MSRVKTTLKGHIGTPFLTLKGRIDLRNDPQGSNSVLVVENVSYLGFERLFRCWGVIDL